MAEAPNIIRLCSSDNVGVALSDLPQGSLIDGSVVTAESIQAMHKVALAHISSGQPIEKFGHMIGVAKCDIAAGSHVHDQNCIVPPVNISTHPQKAASSSLSLCEELLSRAKSSFDGYRAPSGRVGTRNYVAIIPTVNCSVSASRQIARKAEVLFPSDENRNFDGFHVLAHSSGCGGLDRDGQGYANLRRVLAGYAANPNYGAVLIVGLGCEVMQTSHILQQLTPDQSNFKVVNIQEDGGTTEAIARGLSAIEDMMPQVLARQRDNMPISELRVGLQCGGSDSFSGITANPSLGRAMDILVHFGGTAILSETPEIIGAEQILLSRCASEATRLKLTGLVEWWHEHVATFGGQLNNNPSPGNKAGGLTTILEKSLGAVAKSGSTKLEGVFAYGEEIEGQGLVFMDSPGYDPASATGQIAGGANLIAFTTGRGSAFGAKPVPVLKLGSNSDLYRRQSADIDIDCGRLVAGDMPLNELGLEIFNALVEVASGSRTKSELLGYGDDEFVPWHLGPVL